MVKGPCEKEDADHRQTKKKFAHEIPVTDGIDTIFAHARKTAVTRDDVAKIFDVRGSLARRRAIGAPSPENIAAQIKR